MTKSSALVGAVDVDQFAGSLQVPPVAPVQVKVAADPEVVRLNIAAAHSKRRGTGTRLYRGALG
jgi:hypothetical protein